MFIGMYALFVLLQMGWPTSLSPAALGMWLVKQVVLNLPVIWAMSNLASVLGKTPFLFALAAVLPIINLIEALDLVQKATKRLKAAGIRQGFFGAVVPEGPPSTFSGVSPTDLKE
jgi:hypothetical protein